MTIAQMFMGNCDIAEFMNLLDGKHELEYHKSWDDLMPVVEKIETISDPHHGKFAIHIYGNVCSIEGTNLYKAMIGGYDWVYMSDPNAIFLTKIESTWYNVVQFIKWWKTLKHG